MSLYLEFDKIVRALVAAKARFAIAGALAVNLHGHMRATKDIDLLAREADLETIRRVLTDAGYRESGRGVSFRKSGLGLRRFFRGRPREQELLLVDVLLAESQSMKQILKRAVRLPYAELNLPVVSLADLITMKQLRGSLQDEADIEKLKEKRRS